jgi:hypothetical protein
MIHHSPADEVQNRCSRPNKIAPATFFDLSGDNADLKQYWLDNPVQPLHDPKTARRKNGLHRCKP